MASARARAQAAAKLKTSEARLAFETRRDERAQQLLERRTIRSPIDGVVVRRIPSPGE